MKRKAVTFLAFFSLLIAVFAGAAVYGTRAVLNPSDGQYISDIATAEIGVELWENGAKAETLYSSLTDIDPGKSYEDTIAVKNTTENEEYVRVVVRKYWNVEGEKDTSLSPSLIILSPESSSWFENPNERTAERSVYYLRNSLKGEQLSAALFTSISIDKEIAKNYSTSTSTDGKVITVTYTYDNDNAEFVVEMEAQSLQVPEGQKAVTSVWGVTNITADNGTLSLK